ncbi:MAG: tannase/feruloyl esterase family alpha/beta hydrolase [Caldilineaceae bacterium]
MTVVLSGVLCACQPIILATTDSAPQLACLDISSEILGLDNLTIDRAAVVANDTRYPVYCLVQGKVNERTGTDGKSYAIGFELRLPLAWNGRFLYQGNGGTDGVVVPAEGIDSNPHAAGGVSALRRGFAVLSTDAGHNANDPANQAAGMVSNVLFGLDPQARLDYGYAAVGTMTPLAKQIVAQYYGTAPAYSYMYGCSNGGRHGMVAAVRYADEFDGILAGSPGYNVAKATLQNSWDVQHFQLVDPDIRKAFSREDMNLVANGVLAACDALDGAEDGLVNDLRSCQATFNLADLQCSGAKDATCLSPAQVTALERSMAGPTNTAGEQLYASWSYDSGMGAANWRMWKF